MSCTSTATGTQSTKKISIPGFITKTFDIFSNIAYDSLCSWGESGDTIIVKDVSRFSTFILPKYFKHSNYPSFVRQLNMYDFHKTVQDPTHGEFKHQYFRKNRQDLLPLIKRKISSKSEAQSNQVKEKNQHKEMGKNQTEHQLTKYESNSLVNTNNNSSSKEFMTWQQEIEKKLAEMEEGQKMVEAENKMLWESIRNQSQAQREIQSNYQKIFHLMYNLFSGGGKDSRYIYNPHMISSNGLHPQIPGTLTQFMEVTTERTQNNNFDQFDLNRNLSGNENTTDNCMQPVKSETNGKSETILNSNNSSSPSNCNKNEYLENDSKDKYSASIEILMDPSSPSLNNIITTQEQKIDSHSKNIVLPNIDSIFLSHVSDDIQPIQRLTSFSYTDILVDQPQGIKRMRSIELYDRDSTIFSSTWSSSYPGINFSSSDLSQKSIEPLSKRSKMWYDDSGSNHLQIDIRRLDSFELNENLLEHNEFEFFFENGIEGSNESEHSKDVLCNNNANNTQKNMTTR